MTSVLFCANNTSFDSDNEMVKTCFNYDLICATYGREHAHLRDDKRSKELNNTTLLYSRIKFRCEIILKVSNRRGLIAMQ